MNVSTVLAEAAAEQGLEYRKFVLELAKATAGGEFDAAKIRESAARFGRSIERLQADVNIVGNRLSAINTLTPNEYLQDVAARYSAARQELSEASAALNAATARYRAAEEAHFFAQQASITEYGDRQRQVRDAKAMLTKTARNGSTNPFDPAEFEPTI